MKKVLNNTPNPHQSLSLFRRKILGFHPIRQGGSVWSGAPGVIVGSRPRFRPRAAVANDIIPVQIVFIQLCLFAVTAGAWGANDHLVLAPIYPCPGRRRPYRRRCSGTRPRTVVDPPAVLFKYADYTGTFSPILAQHSRCWFCILVDDCLNFGGENHNFLKVYRLIRFIYQENRFNFFENDQNKK